jgi:hypothetical protein
MKITLIENWWTEFKRLWSIRVGVFFCVLNAAMIGFAALVNTIDPWIYFVVNIVGWSAILIARLVKQPGADA